MRSCCWRCAWLSCCCRSSFSCIRASLWHSSVCLSAFIYITHTYYYYYYYYWLSQSDTRLSSWYSNVAVNSLTWPQSTDFIRQPSTRTLPNYLLTYYLLTTTLHHHVPYSQQFLLRDAVTAQGCRLRNDLYCVEWDVKLYYTIPYLYVSAVFAVAQCPSVCPFVSLSVTFVYCIQTAEDIVKHLSSPVTHHSSFWPNCQYPIPRRTASAGALNTQGVGKFVIYDWNRHLAQ